MPTLFKTLAVLGFFVLTVSGLMPWIQSGQHFPGVLVLLVAFALLAGTWFGLAQREKQLQTPMKRLHLLFQTLGFSLFMSGLLGTSLIGFDSFGLSIVFIRFIAVGLLFILLAGAMGARLGALK